MKSILQRFGLHVFIFPFFFVLHAVNENYGLIPAKTIIEYLAYYLILSAILLLIGKWIFKSWTRSAVWTFFLLVIFYFFGAAHDFIRTISMPSFLHSYSFILGFIFVLVIILTAFIWKKNKEFSRLNYFLNLLTVVMLVIELVSYGLNSISFGTPFRYEVKIPPVPKNSELPDIYLIIFDEYASSKALSKYFNYDNSGLDSSLKQAGFYVATNSKSNYNATDLTLNSSLNLDYLERQLEGRKHDPALMMASIKEIRKSILPRYLYDAGYEIKNFGIFDLEMKKVTNTAFFGAYPAMAINLQTLWGRVHRDIWWNFMKLLKKDYESTEIRKHVNDNLNNFALALGEMTKQDDKPKFVYSHLLLPHSPYYIDASGSIMETRDYDITEKEMDSLYLNQVTYSNTLIRQMINAATSTVSRPRIIIIAGDHGYRQQSVKARESQFMNLNAVYFSDGDYSHLYDSISPINTMRAVLNKYFNANLSMVKDSTVLLIPEDTN